MSSRTYTGTKAFALRGTLLERTFVEKLAESTSLDELVNRLRSTPYNNVLSGLAPPFSARKLEVALRERLATVHHSILSTAGRFPILELYYRKNIAWDLKLALKSRALGKTFEEASEFLNMKAEELVGRRDLIVKVLTAKDVSEAVSLLSGTEFSEDAEKALGAFTASGEARFFDIYVDHAVLSRISKEYSKNHKVYSSSRATDVAGVGDIVAADIDAYNVITVLRSKLWGLSEQEVKTLVISPTYRVPLSVLVRMIGTESISEGARLLGSVYPVTLQASQNDEQLIDLVEDTFTSEMKQTSSRAFVWQGLSPGGALALTKLLEFEISDLAAVAIGVEAGIDTKSILAKLRL